MSTFDSPEKLSLPDERSRVIRKRFLVEGAVKM
jgi:hypothetical protein